MHKTLHSSTLVVLLFTLLFVFSGLFSKAQVNQTILTWIDTVKVCPCQTPPQQIIVPVKVLNYDSINSISIVIFYKTAALQYNGYQNVNPALQFPIIVTNTGIGPGGNWTMTRIVSFSTTGFIAIPDSGTMVEFKFNVLCDTTVIVFDAISGPGLFKSSAIIPGFVIANQPVSLSIHEYQAAQFTCSTNLAVGIPTYQWQVKPDSASPWSDLTNNALYNNVNTNTLTIPNADLGFNGFAFRCMVGGCFAYEYSNAAILTVLDSIIPSSGVIEGFVTYDNNSSTPLGNALVTLKQNNVLIFNTFSDSTGHYTFTNLTPGNYELEATPVHPFGGVNSSDGLNILKHFTGLSLLNGLPLIASDVDNNGATNSIDALMCLERFVGIINSFPAGDWVSEKPLVVCNGVNVVSQAVKVLCVGDVDRSYIP